MPLARIIAARLATIAWIVLGSSFMSEMSLYCELDLTFLANWIAASSWARNCFSIDKLIDDLFPLASAQNVPKEGLLTMSFRDGAGPPNKPLQIA